MRHLGTYLPGITRAYTLALASDLEIPVREGDYSLTELYTADEAFTTGTMGGLAHVIEVDGRRIGRQTGVPKWRTSTPSRIKLDFAVTVNFAKKPRSSNICLPAVCQNVVQQVVVVVFESSRMAHCGRMVLVTSLISPEPRTRILAILAAWGASAIQTWVHAGYGKSCFAARQDGGCARHRSACD